MQMRKTIIVLLALLLAAMAMVPVVSAADACDEQMKKWQDDHTIRVTKTVSQKYSEGILTIETTFRGKELTDRYGIDTFTQKKELKIPAEEAEKLKLKSEKLVLGTSEISGVFTAADDPPPAPKSGYPIWLYAESGGVYYQTGDPINMIWSGASLYAVKLEMFEEGWYDYPAEYFYYIYDGGWKVGDGVADDILRLFGGFHIRLWQLSTGEIVGAAHHDTAVPHSADEFEWAEDFITDFYTDFYMWHVYPDNIYLGNSVASPYSNGYAAYIGYW